MRRYVMLAATLAAAAALALGAIACGDDDDDGDRDEATQPPAATEPATTAEPSATEPSATEEPGATEPSGGTVVNIIAADFAFTPLSVPAPSGEPVTFVLENAGSAPHTLTIYSDQTFTTPVEGADTGQVSANGRAEFEVTFDTAGQYYFRCELHPSQMQGTITVD
jgi:plastocyanin